MFGDDALEEQVEWMNKTTFPNDTNALKSLKTTFLSIYRATFEKFQVDIDFLQPLD